MKKKVSFLVLCLLALALILVVPSFAANVAKIGETEYATLNAAYSACPTGGTITLIDNATITSLMNWSSKDKVVTFDGQGE